MPLPNEHSCRVSPPDPSAKTARKNGAAKIAGKPVDHIYQIVGGKSHLQAVRFPRDNGWGTEAATKEARDWCSGEKGTFEAMKAKEEGQEEIETLREQLTESADLEECEGIRDRLEELSDGDESLTEALTEADEKIEALKQVDRVELIDEFTSPVKIVESLSDGRLRVQAIVGQVDTVNKNKRLYPKDEAVKWIERANRLAKRGSMIGCDGHGGFLSSQGARDIVMKWEKIMLNGINIHAEGITVPTAAGKDTRACWESGVALEWSKVGYGNPEDVENKKGEVIHSIIHDYLLDQVDVVLRGADSTKTLSLTVESSEQPPQDEAGEGATVAEPVTPITETPAEVAPTPIPPTVPPVLAPIAEMSIPTVDIGSIVEQVLAATADRDAKSAAETAVAMTERVIAGHKLAEHKVKLIVDTPEKCAPAVKRALAAAKTIEEADEVYAEFLPQIEELLKPKPEYTGIGVITEERHQKQFVDEWNIGDAKMVRPKSSGEAYTQLLDSIEDNGRNRWSNPHNVWKQVLDNYRDQHPEYFESVTQRMISDAATTQTALGTMRAAMLPIIRQTFPALIPWEIAVVWPLDRPTGDIYTIDIIKESSGYALDESAYYDSDWADHTEEASKSQISLSTTSRTVTAIERSVRFELTSVVMQDARALYNLDLQAEMIRAAGGEIARETNFGFIDMLLAQQGGGNVAYGQTIPSGYLGTSTDWNARLAAFIQKAKQYISEVTYMEPDWIIAGPAASSCLKSMKTCMLASETEVRKFGDGLSFIGMVDGTMRLYQAAWFNTNKMLIGYRPPDWSRASAAYCPYVPLYVSPEDYRADTNVLHKSVSARDTMTVLKPAGLATVTISTAAGTDVTFS